MINGNLRFLPLQTPNEQPKRVCKYKNILLLYLYSLAILPVTPQEKKWKYRGSKKFDPLNAVFGSPTSAFCPLFLHILLLFFVHSALFLLSGCAAFLNKQTQFQWTQKTITPYSESV